MSTIIKSFQIESPESGKTIAVDLVEDLEPEHLDFIEARWRPILKRQYDLAILEYFQLPKAEQTPEKWYEVVGRYGVHDQHWEWRTQCMEATKPKYKVLALLSNSEVEAGMRLDFERACRDGSGNQLIYIDYLAVAPWNRKPIQDPVRFQKLGTLMVGAAIAMSLEAGFDGRCGLHSVPQSEGFYQRIGMTDLGVDAGVSMRYFEFIAADALRFIT